MSTCRALKTDHRFVAGQLEISDEGLFAGGPANKTAIPGVYAVGDVLCSHVKQAVTLPKNGAVAAISAEKCCGAKQVPHGLGQLAAIRFEIRYFPTTISRHVF